jgi:hypothetical protein
MNVLLVEPDYYTQYPPLGLLKLSAYYKAQGHNVGFVRGRVLFTDFRPEIIEVSSLFTWAWKPVWDCIAFYKALFPKAHIRLGGVYASLTPEHARESGAHEVFSGIMPHLEDTLPDYSIVPEWHTKQKSSVMFTHRGCVRTCSFCAVPRLEGKPFQARQTKSIRHLVHPEHTRVIFWDNNILGESHWPDVIAEVKELGLEADFNQGLDARYLTEKVAEALRGLRMPAIRVAYDYPGMGKAVKRAIDNLAAVGFRKRHIFSYVLFNYEDTPEDLFSRVRDLLDWGITAYPMRYQPLSGEGAFDKDSFIAPAWDPQLLNMVAKARRVIGFGGAFPPYEGLIKKFDKAKDFADAFGLFPEKPRKSAGDAVADHKLREMGLDHEYSTHALKLKKKAPRKRQRARQEARPVPSLS